MKLNKIAALIAIAAASGSAFATNGYFAHGYGMKAKGMAGVGIALPQDGLAAATNPAGMVMVGDRLDLGVDWFKPNRGAEIVGTGVGINGSYDGNGDSSFLVPEFGYNKMLGWDMSVGVSVYGNGGMNTKYNISPFVAIGGQNPAGVNLEQLFIAPTFAMRLNKDHALGVSIVMAYQTFGATGLQPFDGAGSLHAGSVTNRGNDHSTGWGLRLGWTGQVSENVTLGATYASKIKGKFNDYKGLFAEEGRFDIPENYGIGIAVKATPKLTVAADIQQINYGSVKAIANPNCGGAGCLLGTSGGSGFGWRDMTVFKLGVSYELSKDMTLRAGVSTNRQPIPARETFFNILAPGVVENHLTLGGTWTLANKNELTVGYMHAFKKTVNGSGSVAATGMGAGEANLHMSQDSLGLAYGIKF
ncbi:MAG: outer membrane protein transport protein [Rhodocyclales bacterium]|jgi:long-chain fatty acid transport protein|nr:outer membrane protein transport protein [Rhodocyclales bacterium]